MKRFCYFAFCCLFLALTSGTAVQDAVAGLRLTNVSYDPTREFYRSYNKAFCDYWKKQKGEDITVRSTHGGSGMQARTVIDGLAADIVTLALEADIDAIASRTGRIRKDWRGTLPHDNAPYTSTVVFLVRKNNPKKIRDWDDLVRRDVEVITPNPKTSGGARWNLLAALAWAREHFNGDETAARDYVASLYKRVPVMDTGARGAVLTFIQRGMGDVLLTLENEALLALQERGGSAFEIVVPSVSILAEPPVAIIDADVDANGTREAATAYLQYLYSQEGQTLAAKNGYRPSNPELVDSGILEQFPEQFPEIQLVTIERFGGWKKAQPEFFEDNGFFDQIYRKGR